MTLEEKIITIARTYGYDAQSRQCIEEMAELTQAINKLWRKNKRQCSTDREIELARKNAVEEIADVQIMLWQMGYYLLKTKEIDEAIDNKLDRQIKRIREGSDK